MTRPGGELTTYHARGGHANDLANLTQSDLKRNLNIYNTYKTFYFSDWLDGSVGVQHFTSDVLFFDFTYYLCRPTLVITSHIFTFYMFRANYLSCMSQGMFALSVAPGNTSHMVTLHVFFTSGIVLRFIHPLICSQWCSLYVSTNRIHTQFRIIGI